MNMKNTPNVWRRSFISLAHWFDSDYGNSDLAAIHAKPDKVEFIRVLPFIFLHAGCLGVLVTGFTHQSVFLEDMKPFYGLQKAISIYSIWMMFAFHRNILANVISKARKRDNFLVIH